MNHADPRERRGAHRTGRGATATLVPSLLAILAVSALITALYVWRGEDAGPPRADAAASASRTPAASPSESGGPAKKTGKTSSASTAAESTSPASSPASTTAPVAEVAVVVLNQTGRSGLAGQAGDRLRARGWTVSAVGNFRGTVRATTVYYPPGQQAAAQAAAEDLPTPPRIRPRFGNLSTSRLTVVVTDNYPS